MIAKKKRILSTGGGGDIIRNGKIAIALATVKKEIGKPAAYGHN